jgi:hypothetical protein
MKRTRTVAVIIQAVSPVSRVEGGSAPAKAAGALKKRRMRRRNGVGRLVLWDM